MCDAYWEDPNVITVKYPQNALCNYYLCEVNVYDPKFKSSEHAFQWKFAKHVGRDDQGFFGVESSHACQR